MNDIAIRVEKLSKRYRIGAAQRRHDTLRDAIADGARSLVRPFRKNGAAEAETLWALRDVSFEIRRGEVVGIIGRNGAGKSTLLRILSRITKPTEGWADVHGRVGSLLEVGTGFHSELTGRENLFLNGAILGMKRAEIDRKFDEIVAFAEVERFIDTPVKHYSSGMYLRLAFAVAAHLEPDIMVVDEVLAVGDLAFQKKCLDRLTADAHERKVTALYVSHNISTIKSLCRNAILLNEGHLVRYGPAHEVCDEYSGLLEQGVVSAIKRRRLHKSDEATIYDCWCESGGKRAIRLTMPGSLDVRVVVDVHRRCLLSFALIVKDNFDRPLALAQYGLAKEPPLEMAPGHHEFLLRLPTVELAAGQYSVDVTIGEPNRRFFDYVEDALSVEVSSPTDPLTGWWFQQSTGQGAVLLNCDLTRI